MYLKKALHGTFIVFTLSLLGGLFGYLMRILLARKLTIEEFGLFYSVITIFLFIAYFIDAGLGQAVSRKIVEFRLRNKERKINNLILSILSLQLLLSFGISIIIIIYAPLLSTKYFHANVTSMLYIMCAWLVSLPILGLISYTIYGFQKSELFSFIDMLKYVLLFVFSGIGIFLGGGSYAPIWAYLITNILLILLGFFLIKRVYPQFSLKFKFDKKLSLEIFNFGIMIFFSSLAWMVITQVDTIVLTYFTNATQVGLYQIAVPLAALILYIVNSLSIIVFPLVTELAEKKDIKRLVDGLRLIYKYAILIILPLVIILFSFSETIIQFFFGPGYLGAATVLRILAISTIFFSITIINNVVTIALGSPRRVAQMMFFVALLNLVLNIILVPKYGIVGAAMVSLTSFVLAFILSSYNIRKKITIKFPILSWILASVIGVGLLFVIIYLKKAIVLHPYLELVIISAIAGMIYTGLLLLLRIIKLQDIKEILVQFKR